MNGKQLLRWGAAVPSLLVFLAVTAGCGSSGSSSSSSSSGTGTSASQVTKGGTIGVFEPVANALDACKDLTMSSVLKGAGYQVNTYYSNFQPATSSQNIQDALTKGIVGAVYSGQAPPVDLQALTKLAGPKIPTVLNLASTPKGTNPAVAMDLNYQQTSLQGVNAVLQQMPNVKHVALIAGVQGTEASDAMQKYTVEGLAQHGIKPEVVAHGDFTSKGGAQIAQDLLQAHPDVQVIMVLGDDMALGAEHIVQTEGKSARVVDVNGFSKAALKALEQGRLLAMVYAPVDEWGTMIGQAMVRTLKGQSGAKSLVLPTKAVTKESASQITTRC